LIRGHLEMRFRSRCVASPMRAYFPALPGNDRAR